MAAPQDVVSTSALLRTHGTSMYTYDTISHTQDCMNSTMSSFHGKSPRMATAEGVHEFIEWEYCQAQLHRTYPSLSTSWSCSKDINYSHINERLNPDRESCQCSSMPPNVAGNQELHSPCLTLVIRKTFKLHIFLVFLSWDKMSGTPVITP